MPNGYPKLTQQDGCIEHHKQDSRALNILLLENIVTTQVHSAKISHFKGQGKPRRTRLQHKR